MSRVTLICLGGGVVALALAVLVGGVGVDLARSGLAAWLVVMALPLGALPVLMMLELAGLGAMPGTAALRGLLAILPLAAVAGALGLLYEGFAPGHSFAALYGWSDATGGFAARWFTPGWFGARSILYLAIWVALAVVFMMPAQPSAHRRAIAAWGLALHLVVGTLAAIDWTLSLDLGLNASVFGLLLMTLQCAFALTVALLVTAGGSTRALRLMTLAAVAAAAFLQFVQYLVVWSANLPREIVWYQHRFGGLGAVLFLAAPVILSAAAAVLSSAGSIARRWPVLVAAGPLALLEIADLLWLVTPSWRGTFSVSALDLLALVGMAGVLGACALFITRPRPEARRG